MSETFKYTVKKGSEKKALSHAMRIAEKNGMQIKGNDNSGSLSGKGISGEYSVNGNCITILINSIPWFISWSLARSKLNGFFNPFM